MLIILLRFEGVNNMSRSFLTQIKGQADRIKCGNPIYDWSLNGDVPERLQIKPVDCWPGDEEKGRALLSDEFTFANEFEVAPDLNWHSFAWLRDLRMVGGDAARKRARQLMNEWMDHHNSWDELVWRPDITATRLSMWISHYEIFVASADTEFQDHYFETLVRQARHLSKSIAACQPGLPQFQVAHGLIYAGLAFEGYQAWIEQGLEMMERLLAQQILADGCHISRSPEQLLEALQICLDIRIGMKSGGYPVPAELQHAIDKMTPALRFFRAGDKHFYTFHGSQIGAESNIDAALLQSNARGKALQSLPVAGFERIQQGRSSLIMDVSEIPERPYDACTHAAPLSFEFSYGKDRVFISCGSHPHDEKWREALRGTAAHTALSLDEKNAAEISLNGHLKRCAKKIVVLREEDKDYALLEASHDGYVPLNGVTHCRRLFLSHKGQDLRGEEILSASPGHAKSVDIAARFHLHPRVMVSLVQEGRFALIRLPCGVGWRFHASVQHIALEDSIYLGEGHVPRKTKQLVLYDRMDMPQKTMKWALQREG